jgi:aminomethyltransferase
MELKKTPLYDIHKGLGARFTEFSGWLLPLEYSSIMEEHAAVRRSCGIFDVSHMGEIEVSGEAALSTVELLTTNRVSTIGDGECRYSFVCNEKGGVVDDAIVYRFSSRRFLFCVNAANTKKVFDWMRGICAPIEGVTIKDLSASYAQTALQGPRARDILSLLTDISAIGRNHFSQTKLRGMDVMISGTGYTGENGFEIYCAPETAAPVWLTLMEEGKRFSLAPCGLGARNTLRIEAGYPLYSHELDEGTTPLEAGLSRFVSFEKDFIGKKSLLELKEAGLKKTLVGLETDDRRVPREGCPLFKDGKKIGAVTSGTFSPTLKRPIAMAYIDSTLSSPSTEIEIEIRGKPSPAKVVRMPFYTSAELSRA